SSMILVISPAIPVWLNWMALAFARLAPSIVRERVVPRCTPPGATEVTVGGRSWAPAVALSTRKAITIDDFRNGIIGCSRVGWFMSTVVTCLTAALQIRCRNYERLY